MRPPPPPPDTQPPVVPPWLIPASILVGGLVVIGTVWFFLLRPAQTTSQPTAIALTPAPSPTIPQSTVAPLPATSMPSPSPAIILPNLSLIQQTLRDLVDAQRRAAGQAPLAIDQIASTASARHAQEMVDFGYESLLDLDGHDPSYRYNAAGGYDAIRQHVLLVGEIAPTSEADWQAATKSAVSDLLDNTETKADLLAPTTTHYSIDFAYNKETHHMALLLSFIAHYVEIDTLPQRAKLGESITAQGRLLRGARAPELRLTYEVYPSQRSVADLNNHPSLPHPEPCLDLPLAAQSDGSFSQDILLNCNNQPGLYHLQITIETPTGRIDAIDRIIDVR